jgi:hypothetical protein
MADLRDEVATLKRRMSTVEERQQMEAGLAASRDRDLSDLGVKIKQLQPMLQGLQERLPRKRRPLSSMRLGSMPWMRF